MLNKKAFMRKQTPESIFVRILRNDTPSAAANIIGNDENSALSGTVKFYNTPYGGILVEAELFELPKNSAGFYGMHIHNTGDCTPPFQRTGEHYNPTGQPHPGHSGDLIPLLGNDGYAFTSFFDKRFTLTDILGRSVIIHAMPDDFTTQPSGNSGEKIGCGVITKQ